MKYISLLLALLANFSLAQTVLTVTERKVTVAGGASYSSFKTNDDTLKAASSLAEAACAVNPSSKVYGRITFEYTCAKASSSKSVSSATSSVGVSSSSVAVSSAQSSSVQSSSSGSVNTVPVAGVQKLNVCMPLARTNEDLLPKEEMIAYKFRLFSPTGYVETEQRFTGNECDTYTVTIPEGALRLDVAAVATASPDSAYIAVEF